MQYGCDPEPGYNNPSLLHAYTINREGLLILTSISVPPSSTVEYATAKHHGWFWSPQLHSGRNGMHLLIITITCAILITHNCKQVMGGQMYCYFNNVVSTVNLGMETVTSRIFGCNNLATWL